jgi:pyrroline-5-carboxylate reductase
MQKIGIIGYGNMGQAIAQRLKDKYTIFVFEKDESKLKDTLELTLTATIEGLVEQSNVVILAIKPQDFDEVLENIKEHVTGKLLVSIAAGITTEYIEKKLGTVHVIRVMSNLAATVNAGMSCICKGRYASSIDLSFLQVLFNRLGKTLLIDEKLMNAATAVSGSGPGFLFALFTDKPRIEWEEFARNDFIPKLAQAAEKIGFSHEHSVLLAKVTAEGSLTLLRETKLPPELLRLKVTSKGGTTEAGLVVLNNDIINLEGAVKAALARAEELIKK